MPDPASPLSTDPQRIAPEADQRHDPLSHLHRMSRTAGLGTQEYVAINAVAVTTLLLGFASALAMVSSILLIIPIAGVICAVVSLWQIRNSNGTQSGRGLAWAGLVLCLLFAGVAGTREAVTDYRMRNDKRAVMETVELFGKRLSDGHYQAAYDMLSERFREQLSFDEFKSNLEFRFNHPAHGKIVSMRSNGRVAWEKYEGAPNRFATTLTVIQLEGREEPDRQQQMGFQKLGDHWVIEGFGWFPPKPLAPSRTLRQ